MSGGGAALTTPRLADWIGVDMTTVQVTPDTFDDRHDYRFWDRIAGYVDGECVGCSEQAICFEGMCQACWTGQDIADELQRALDKALRSITTAADLLDAVTDKDRLREVYGQINRVAAATANLRCAGVKRCLR